MVPVAVTNVPKVILPSNFSCTLIPMLYAVVLILANVMLTVANTSPCFAVNTDIYITGTNTITIFTYLLTTLHCYSE